MRIVGFWVLPVVAPDIVSLIAERPHLTGAGMAAVEILLNICVVALWIWCGISLLREHRRKAERTVINDVFASSWAAKLEGETYIMLPPNEKMREKIRSSNRLVMDIGKVPS